MWLLKSPHTTIGVFGVLSNDIPDDVKDSFGAVLQVLLLSRVEITVENLDVCVPELELGQTHVGPE